METITPRFYTLDEIIAMPPEEQSKAIQAAFDAAADEDFEIFEAYDAEDFDDYDE